MKDAFNGEPDETPEAPQDEDLDLLIHRVSLTDRKQDIERVGELFDTAGEPQEMATPAPQPDLKKEKPRQSRREKWNQRRSRRNQRGEQIQRRQTGDRTHARRKSFRQQNIIALFFFLATIGVLIYFAILWINPQSPLNILPPPTPLPLFVTATPSGNLTEARNESPQADIRFTLQGEVTYRAHLHCEHASIAGNVQSNDGTIYAVRISGVNLDSGVFSGSMLEYGQGGFEFQIGDAPLAEMFTIQLFTTDEIPVSKPVQITTRSACEENIAFIQFVEGD